MIYSQLHGLFYSLLKSPLFVVASDILALGSGNKGPTRVKAAFFIGEKKKRNAISKENRIVQAADDRIYVSRTLQHVIFCNKKHDH